MRPHRTALAALIALLLLAACDRSASEADGAAGPALYVRAGAAAGGDGTLARPFATLAQVQQASAAGDTIMVLASDAVLEGGIVLKPQQRLIGLGAPRLSNTDAGSNNGDVVTLAPGAEVAGLVLTGSVRGGIYGLNVPGVSVHDNDVSGHNTSCTHGIIIPPDTLPTNFPGVTFPNPAPLPNGWAGIYLLADQGEGDVSVRNNLVHDSACGDGIDIGLSGAAVYTALIDGNETYNLTQSGPIWKDILSILAVGMQTRDTSRLTATVSNNVQHDIGTANSQTADPECVYPNVVDASSIVANISNNDCSNSVGGWSANGLEIPLMNDGGSAIINVSDSRFTDVTSDIIEPIALGTNQYLEVNLLRVTAARANGNGASPLIDIAGQFSYGNEGDCISMFSTDAGNTLKLTVKDSILSGCYFNGLSIASNHAPGGAATPLIAFEIDNSVLTGNHGNGLRFYNGSGLTKLVGKVQNSNLGGNALTANLLAPRHDLNLKDQGSAADVTLDFGGGALGSAGGNCIGAAGVSNDGLSVSMKNNWWGAAGGPAAGAVSGSGTTDVSQPLAAAPAICR